MRCPVVLGSLEPTRLTKENLLELYRFALLLKGEEKKACSILIETLGDAASDLDHLRNPRSRLAFIIKKLRTVCLKEELSTVFDSDPGLLNQFTTLPEPERSVLALHYLNLFSPDDTAALLDLNPDQFSTNLHQARVRLKLLLQITELDAEWLKEINTIELPLDLEPQFLLEGEQVGNRVNLRKAWHQPSILAVMIALMVLLGWFIYSAVLRADNFPGQEVIEELITLTEEMNGTELNPKSTEVGLLGDWLFSQYGFENYSVPDELAHLQTVGCRVFKHNGVSVAQIAINQQASFLFLFHAEDLGVKISPVNRWRIFKIDDWMVAIQACNEECVMIAFHGTKDEMRDFLQH